MASILVTNDDGISSPGLWALAQALERVGEVVILAPDRNWSAAGHPKTMHKPLRIDSYRSLDGSGPGPAAFACSGAPSDCVALGLMGALDRQFDLVVSGINTSFNLGADVLYSGTVAGAMEAIISGVPAIAISVGSVEGKQVSDEAIYGRAAAVGATLAEMVLQKGLAEYTLLNVNLPRIPLNELGAAQITRLGRRIYRGLLTQRDDPWGKPYYWIGGEVPSGHPEMGSDIGAVESGCISITPLGIDLTRSDVIASLEAWDLASLAAAGDDS